MPRSPYDDLDLRALEVMWEVRACEVEAAKREIDATGVSRPARDAFEREWLQAHDRSGMLIEAEPLSPEQVARRCPTRRQER